MVRLDYFIDGGVERAQLTQAEGGKESHIWKGYSNDVGWLLYELVSLHTGPLSNAIHDLTHENLQNQDNNTLAKLYVKHMQQDKDIDCAKAMPTKAIQLIEAIFYVTDAFKTLEPAKKEWTPVLCAAIESLYEMIEAISGQDDVEAALLAWMQSHEERLSLPSQRIMRRTYFFPNEPDALIRVQSVTVVDDKGEFDRSFMTYYLCGMLDHALQSGMPIRQCQHCGGFFLPKERRDERYCRRMTGEGMPCNIIGPRSQYQQTKGDNPYLKAFKSAYNKYRYQEKTGMITSAQFSAWADAARSLRDTQMETEPVLTPAEFKKTINERDFFNAAQIPR